MSDNANGTKEVTQLHGREITIVKNGLSEPQVVSLINDLARERDELIERQEHLNSLTRLAERTVSEADTLAGEMKELAKKEAGEEVERIIAEAHERAERLVQEKEAEAMATAQSRAEEIKTEAEKLATEIMTDAETKADQVRTDAEAEATNIISEAQSKGRAMVAEKESEARELAEQQAKEILSKAREQASGMLEREKKRIQPELDGFMKGFRTRFLSELDVLTDRVSTLEPGFVNSRPSGAKAISSAPGNIEGQDDLMQLFSGPGEADTAQPDWRLNISPPVDVARLMNVVSHLDTLDEVRRTEINSYGDQTSIEVYLNAGLELIPMLSSLPEVSLAEEKDTSGDSGDVASETRTVNVVLSAEPEDLPK